MDDSTFGARLALVRQRMQWNIKEAARECGQSPTSWASWEAGSMPRRYTEVCDQIADRTGASVLWLIMGSSRPTGTVKRRADLNDSSARLVLTGPQASADQPRIHPISRVRHDSTRPTSAVPVTRRRPAFVRPGERPIPR